MFCAQVAGGGKGGKGGTRLLDGVSGTCHRGEILGLLGPSGAGKSTLLKLITGTSVPTLGSVKVNGRVAALLANEAVPVKSPVTLPVTLPLNPAVIVEGSPIVNVDEPSA